MEGDLVNKEKIRDILTWYGYGNVRLDKYEDNQTYYFRTDNMIHNYVIKVEVKDGFVDIHQATEDFYENYETDFYDFNLEARFTFDEIAKYMNQ